MGGLLCPPYLFMGLDLKKLIDDLDAFDPHAVLLGIVTKNGERIVELQQEQLAAGIDNTGQPRVDEYRPFTIEQKHEFGIGLGAVTDHVTFFMTGEMYSEMSNVIFGDEFEVRALGEKFDKMMERIGDERYGLDEESRRKFAEEITIPEFKNELFAKTGLEL